MANIVVVSNSNFVKVDFGIYGQPLMIMSKASVLEACEFHGGTMVKTGSTRDKFTWFISWEAISALPDGTIFMIVDSINGTAPTSNTNLIDLLYAL